MAYSKSQKHCATCNNWSGNRKLDGVRSLVAANTLSKGECLLPEGPRKGQKTSATSACLKWEMWGVLQ